MIPFNFEYYRPETVKEAVKLFGDLNLLGKKVIYYGGGSEFISMARVGNVYADAVIDIKGIDECMGYILKDEDLIIGAGVTLSRIAEGNLFPLLTMAVKRIADHTMQGKITIGGNMCGTIIYKESILPLLVSDSEVVLEGLNGRRREFINDIFHDRLELDRGEMIVKIIVPQKFLHLPHWHIKRTKNEVVDYPLITAVGLRDKQKINIAFSGLGDYPFRSKPLEDILNNKGSSKKNLIEECVDSVEDEIKDSLTASKEFKKFMLHHVLEDTVTRLKEGKHWI